MSEVRELAVVERALARAREKSAQLLEALRARRRRRRPPRRQLAPGRRRAKLARALEKLHTERLLKGWGRDELLQRTSDELRRGTNFEAFDAFTACLKMEASPKGRRCVRDVQARTTLAEKLRSVGARFGRDAFMRYADKLEKARREGWAGVRESDGSPVFRMRDRSGLIMLDPADARERTAELIARVMPLLLVCAKKGYELHFAVFTVPNIPAGSLAWGKKAIFTDIKRRVLERGSSGEALATRALDEIVGAIGVQEDPLAIDAHTWNVHVNAILVVDPGKCTPLDRELWPDDPDNPGEKKRDPAADHAGMFSYMKLRHIWGLNVHVERIDPKALRSSLLEVFKYACKTVSEKSLAKFQDSTPAPVDAAPEVTHASAGSAPAFELVDDLEAQLDEANARRPAPAMVDWADERVLEWLDANKGFRRVRGWGCVYRIGKLPRATDPDEGIRWIGRVWVSPYKITVQCDAFDALPVESIRENKSRHPTTAYEAQGPPRAGPQAS